MKYPQTRLLRAAWAVLLVPGVGQFLLLCTAMFSRVRYPYDLEWMEGGLLTHADRIAAGLGIYVEPSVTFIPYLYTPLYPGILAMGSGVLGISYFVGRMISVLATLGLCGLLVQMIRSECRAITPSAQASQNALGWLGGAIAVGFFAATYPWVEGWYDLVRADSLFLLMVVGGLYGIRKWARSPGRDGMAKLAAMAAILGLSFFAKQTGVLFVATGGCMLLILNWRRIPLYVGVTGAIGLGGTWLLNRSSEWFWIYIYQTHQSHDFSMERFYQSFGNMLWHFPMMTLVIGLGFVSVAVTIYQRRELAGPAKAFLIWLGVFVLAVVIGAIGWGTQFAHFNAYIPAMTFGALCAGLAIPTVAGCVAQRWSQHMGRLVGGTVAMGLGVQLLLAWWQPARFVPSAQDRRAGDALIAAIGNIEGDVFIPYHPWYAKLAGKPTYTHLMGLRDMTTGDVKWPIVGLNEALAQQKFAAVITDNRPLRELRHLHQTYRVKSILPATSAPHVFTGAGAVWNRNVRTLVPHALWIPNVPVERPSGATVLWDFEHGNLRGWTRNGSAWGHRPVGQSLPGQGLVVDYGGRYYLSSFHGGDKSVGTLQSKRFVISGQSIHFRLSGGTSQELRVELHNTKGEVLHSTTPTTNSERMESMTWDVAAYRGETVEIHLIDNATGSWGHINVDEFWEER